MVAIHAAHIALLVKYSALEKRFTNSWFDSPISSRPEYKGIVVYDDPRIHGTAFTFVYGIDQVFGGGLDTDKGFDYLKKLHPDKQEYAR